MWQEMSGLNATATINIYNTSINSTHYTTTFDDLAKDKLERFTPSIVYTTTLMLIGFPGNLLVWYVYYTNWKKCTARIFILSLATLDLINCLSTLPLEIAVMKNFLNFDYSGICKLFRFITYTMNCSSNLVLVAIAVDRWDRICRPHEHHLTTRAAKIICIVSVIISVSVTWPSLIIYGIQTSKVFNVHIKICLIEKGYISTPYPLVYYTILSFLTLVNFIVLCIFYSIIGVHIWRRWRWRSECLKRNGSEKVSRQDSSEYVSLNTKLDGDGRRYRLNGNKKVASPSVTKISESAGCSRARVRELTCALSNRSVRRVSKTTLMLFVITLIYIVSFLPFLILVTIRSLHPNFMRSLSKSVDMALQVVLRSYLINSAVNPIIYSFCNELFRTKCRQVFSNLMRCKKNGQ